MNKGLKKNNTIVICASVSAYKQVVDVKNQLKKMGLNVVMPKLAEIMEKAGNFEFDFFKAAYLGSDRHSGKGQAIKRHFKRIEKGNKLLVLNLDKNGIKGYIGPNVLMEMGLAFYLGKMIYILNNIDTNHPFIDEIFGMKPRFLDAKLEDI